MKTAAVFVLIIASFAACDRRPVQKDLPHSTGTMDRSKMQHSDMESSPNVASAPYALQFLDTMIAHHEGAIDMAQLAQTRAQHQEIKSLARSIVSDQQKEIEQMREWRGKYFAGAPPAINMDLPGMREGMNQMDLEKLDELKENAFDLEFIRQMVPHHEGAVEMAKDAVAKTSAGTAVGPELADVLRVFAKSITDAQSAEIKQMKEWQAAWSKN